MATFELVELALDPKDIKVSLEDEFTAAAVLTELEKLETKEELLIGSQQLLKFLMKR